jgi:hypothetical protein
MTTAWRTTHISVAPIVGLGADPVKSPPVEVLLELEQVLVTEALGEGLRCRPGCRRHGAVGVVPTT